MTLTKGSGIEKRSRSYPEGHFDDEYTYMFRVQKRVKILPAQYVKT